MSGPVEKLEQALGLLAEAVEDIREAMELVQQDAYVNACNLVNSISREEE